MVLFIEFFVVALLFTNEGRMAAEASSGPFLTIKLVICDRAWLTLKFSGLISAVIFP